MEAGVIAAVVAAVGGALGLVWRIILGEWNLREALQKRKAAARPQQPSRPPPQPVPAELPPSAPAVSTLPTPTVATALPASDPHFVGRTDEISTIVDALLNGRSVLVHGEPGIGKTALAVYALRSTAIQNAFRDRLLWFDRTPETLAGLCDAVARPLRLQPVWDAEDEDQKCDILRANLGDHPLLLAFNNTDGSAAGAVAAFCQWVIPSPILATSRDTVPGLERLDLGPLDAEQALALFASYSRTPASAEEGDVREVLTFLQNNPLAVVLAAGRCRGLGAVALLKQLQERPLDVLKDSNRSVRAAFDLSYDLLEPQEQRLFAAQGVFEGPDFTAEAVQALFDADVGLELGHLVDVSLVRRDPEVRRYSLHPLLGEYARGRLEDADLVQLRLAAYYAGFVQQREEATPEHLYAIAAEFASIRGTVGWCIAHRDEERPTLLLTDTVGSMLGADRFLGIRGYWWEWVGWGGEAVEAARRLGNDHRLAVIAGNLATAYSHRGAVAEAEKGFREALEAFRRLDDEWNLAGALHQLGRPATDQGRIEEARDLYNRSLGDQHGMANTLGQLGNLARRRGAPEEAQGFFGRCMEVFERLGE